MDDRSLRRVAVALAAVAVVVVVAAAGLAGQRYVGRDAAAPVTSPTPRPLRPSVEVPEPSGVPTPTAFPGGRIVFGLADHDAVFEIPAGWTAFRGAYGLEVSDDYEGLLPKVFDPARVGDGWCPKDDSETRAYVGWGPATQRFGPDVRATNRGVLAPWDVGYHYDVDPRFFFPPRAGPPRRIRLDDGTRAWVSSITGAIREKDCPSITASQVTVLSFRNTAADNPDAAVTNLVGYRSIGTGDDVSQAQVLRVMRTVRGLDQ